MTEAITSPSSPKRSSLNRHQAMKEGKVAASFSLWAFHSLYSFWRGGTRSSSFKSDLSWRACLSVRDSEGGYRDVREDICGMLWRLAIPSGWLRSSLVLPVDLCSRCAHLALRSDSEDVTRTRSVVAHGSPS